MSSVALIAAACAFALLLAARRLPTRGPVVASNTRSAVEIWPVLALAWLISLAVFVTLFPPHSGQALQVFALIGFVLALILALVGFVLTGEELGPASTLHVPVYVTYWLCRVEYEPVMHRDEPSVIGLGLIERQTDVTLRADLNPSTPEGKRELEELLGRNARRPDSRSPDEQGGGPCRPQGPWRFDSSQAHQKAPANGPIGPNSVRARRGEIAAYRPTRGGHASVLGHQIMLPRGPSRRSRLAA
jgi:hypothetical protein